MKLRDHCRNQADYRQAKADDLMLTIRLTEFVFTWDGD
jgi:hypothetical protein